MVSTHEGDRVFTLEGGDMTVMSLNGNIDAGKGAKTVQAIQPPDHHAVDFLSLNVPQQPLVLRARFPSYIGASVVVDVHGSSDPVAPGGLGAAVVLLSAHPKALARGVVRDAAVDRSC